MRAFLLVASLHQLPSLKPQQKFCLQMLFSMCLPCDLLGEWLGEDPPGTTKRIAINPIPSTVAALDLGFR